jgi:hypothetical protein
MHDHLKAEIELMGYKAQDIKTTTHAEQDFLIMTRLMKITRSDDFTEEELQFYQTAAAVAADDRYVVGSRILTKDFSEEELKDYQWSAEHPTGSCRGFRLTEDPTEEEVKEWQETTEWLNKLDLVALRKKVEFEREEPEPVLPQGEDPDYNPHSWEGVVAQCPLGTDPYHLRPDNWCW